mgnify:CR=1 FL=1
MSIRRESSFTDDKTVMKGGGQDVAVGNPGMMYDTDTPTNQSLATPKRGSDVISATQGSGETFDVRSKVKSDDHDIFNFNIDTPAATDRVLFIADREMRLISATARITTAGGTGYKGTLKKADSGTAIGSGTAISAEQALTGVSTNTNISIAPVEADAVISEGQAVGIDLGGTAGSAAGLALTLVFRRVVEPSRTSTVVE